MFKLVAATLAAIFIVLLVFGDDSRREDVSKSEREPTIEFSLTAFIPKSNEIDKVELEPTSTLSDNEAVQVAIEAAELHRANRLETKSDDFITIAATVEAFVNGNDVAADTLAVESWYVSGTRVNLRAGPGTTNAVVARLGFGTEAEVLSDTAAAWNEIRTADGTAGWISSKFLTETAPG